MSPIGGRSREHLGTSDVAVAHLRRLLLHELTSLFEGGDPLGLDPTIPFGLIDSAATVLPREALRQASPMEARAEVCRVPSA